MLLLHDHDETAFKQVKGPARNHCDDHRIWNSSSEEDPKDLSWVDDLKRDASELDVKFLKRYIDTHTPRSLRLARARRDFIAK